MASSRRENPWKKEGRKEGINYRREWRDKPFLERRMLDTER